MSIWQQRWGQKEPFCEDINIAADFVIITPPSYAAHQR